MAPHDGNDGSTIGASADARSPGHGPMAPMAPRFVRFGSVDATGSFAMAQGTDGTEGEVLRASRPES